MAKHPVTMAIRTLRSANVAFTPHLYTWEAHGGTAASAAALGVDEHAVVKTLVFEDETAKPCIVLMHGDREVSTKNLARHLKVKTTVPCSPATVTKHTGYVVGGVSPFGTRKALPVYVERTILELPRIYINGGRRGYLVGIAPAEVVRVLGAEVVDVRI